MLQSKESKELLQKDALLVGAEMEIRRPTMSRGPYLEKTQRTLLRGT